LLRLLVSGLLCQKHTVQRVLPTFFGIARHGGPPNLPRCRSMIRFQNVMGKSMRQSCNAASGPKIAPTGASASVGVLFATCRALNARCLGPAKACHFLNFV
jgi:hypothetical protein